MRLNKALLTTAVVLSLAVAGCSGGSSNGGAAESGPVTLSYGVWDQNQVPALKQVIANFEKTNKNIKVKIQVTPYDQYFTKLQAAATGGAAPDVFWMNGPNFQLYASNGVLAPISDQIKKDGLDTSVYPKSLVDLYSLDGKQYALPKDFDTIGLWYNKKLFDDAGVKYPDATWTWTDLQDAAAKLTNKSKGIYGIPASLEGQQNFYNTILQAGGHVLSADGKSSGYDDPATIKGLSFWTDLIKSGSSPSLKQMTDTLPLQWFESGKAAMFYGGSWNVIEFKKNEYTADKIDVAPLPKGEKQGVVIHGLGNVISAKTKHSDAAWQFVKYLMEPAQNVEIVLSGGGRPALRSSVLDNDRLMKEMKAHKCFAPFIKSAEPWKQPANYRWAEFNATVLQVFADLWLGKQTVDQAIADAKPKFQAILDKPVA